MAGQGYKGQGAQLERLHRFSRDGGRDDALSDGAGASACVARAQAKGADDRHACIAATALAPMCTKGAAVAGARWEQAENRAEMDGGLDFSL